MPASRHRCMMREPPPKEACSGCTMDLGNFKKRGYVFPLVNPPPSSLDIGDCAADSWPPRPFFRRSILPAGEEVLLEQLQVEQLDAEALAGHPSWVLRSANVSHTRGDCARACARSNKLATESLGDQRLVSGKAVAGEPESSDVRTEMRRLTVPVSKL